MEGLFRIDLYIVYVLYWIMSKRGLFILVVIILVGSVIAEDNHPRLFFYEEDIQTLRDQAQTTHNEIWEAVKYYADNRLAEQCRTHSQTGGNPVGSTVFTLAFAYVITEDESYLTKAKECMLVNADPIKWPEWDTSGTRDLYLADMLMKNSLAYDWLYNHLTTAERDTIRESLARHATEMYEAADYDNQNWTCWWPRSFIQNHRTTNNAALGVTALAIEGEPGYAQAWLDHAINQFQIEKYLLSQIDEGTWHEGYNYQNAVFSPTLPFYVNLQRLKGINLLAEEYARNYVTWKAYNYLPDSEYPVFAIQSLIPDWGWNAGLHQVSLRYLASRFNDGHGEFVAQQILEESTRDRYKGHHAPNMVYEFLYYNASIAAKPLDDLPLEAYYPDMGIVTWRTGWGDDDIVFGYKSSKYGGKWASNAFFNKEYPFNMTGSNANVGHNHADANTFALFKGGTDLSSEKQHRQSWNQPKTWPMTAWHNTIFVDDENQFMFHRQGLVGHDVGGVIESVATSENFNYLAADATDMYRSANSNWEPLGLTIDEFTRHVLFAKPDYFVMVDNLRSDTSHKYEFVAQIGPSLTTTTNHITVSGDWVKGVVGSDVIGINVLAPEEFAYSKGISAVPDSGQNYDKAHIKIRPQANIDNMRFITILYPTTDSEWNNRPDTVLLGDTTNGAAIRVNQTETQDHVFRYGDQDEIIVGGYTLKGDAASVEKDSTGDIKEIFLVNGTRLYKDGVVLVEAYSEHTFEAVFSGSNLEIFGQGITGLSIYAPDTDENQVTVNGVSVNASKSGDYISVSGPAVCGPADDNSDGIITNLELQNFIHEYRTTGDVSMNGLLSAINNWKTICSQ